MIRGVLFDFDGVLCDLRDVHFAALNTALAAHGYEKMSRECHLDHYDGLPTLEKLKRMVGQKWVREEDVASVAAVKQKETIRAAASVPFDPSIYCLLAGLSRLDVPIAVVSNAVRATVESALRCMKVWGMLDAAVTNEDGRCKPYPDLHLEACRRLGVEPGECLAVEDNRYGIDAAASAGCVTQIVSSPREVTPKLIWRHLCSTS